MTQILGNVGLTAVEAVLLVLLCSEAVKCASIDASTEKLSDSVVPLVFPEDNTKYKIITTNITDQQPPLLFPTNDNKYKIPTSIPETLPKVPLEFPKDDKKYNIVLNKSSMIPEKPPSVFPEDKARFNIIPSNITIVKSLTHKDINQRQLESTKYDTLKKEIETLTKTDKNVTPNANPKLDNELIQVPGSYMENAAVKHHEEVHGHVGRWVLISLSTFVMLIVVGYAGFLAWKKKINRSNSRHILINEEDSIHDYKHSEF